MNLYTIIGVGAVATLVACSKSHSGVGGDDPAMNLVRAQPSKAQGLTLGQVLDNSPNCASRKWSTEKDKYGRDVVTFKCDLTIPRERLDVVRQKNAEIFRSNVESFGRECPELARAYLDQTQQKYAAYYDRFNSANEVLQFVVNQGEIVETRAGLNDSAGNPSDLNAYGIGMIADDLQETGDGKTGLDHFVQMVVDGAPFRTLQCYQMKELSGLAASSPGTVQPAASGIGSVNLGDAQPEPKGD